MAEQQFKDALGTALALGDIVAYMAGYRSKRLVPCEVIGFSAQMLRLRRLSDRSLEPCQGGYEHYAGPASCVRIDVKAYLGLAS